jgi:hypothetical protein
MKNLKTAVCAAVLVMAVFTTTFAKTGTISATKAGTIQQLERELFQQLERERFQRPEAELRERVLFSSHPDRYNFGYPFGVDQISLIELPNSSTASLVVLRRIRIRSNRNYW